MKHLQCNICHALCLINWNYCDQCGILLIKSKTLNKIKPLPKNDKLIKKNIFKLNENEKKRKEVNDPNKPNTSRFLSTKSNDLIGKSLLSIKTINNNQNNDNNIIQKDIQYTNGHILLLNDHSSLIQTFMAQITFLDADIKMNKHVLSFLQTELHVTNKMQNYSKTKEKMDNLKLIIEYLENEKKIIYKKIDIENNINNNNINKIKIIQKAFRSKISKHKIKKLDNNKNNNKTTENVIKNRMDDIIQPIQNLEINQFKLKIDQVIHNESKLTYSYSINEERLIIKIQNLYRGKIARKKIKELAKGIYEKYYDPSSGNYFYYNWKTQQSQWLLPSFIS